MNKLIIKKTPLDSWINCRINSAADILRKKDLDEYQLKKIRETVTLAVEKSSFYRNHLKNFADRDINSPDDFAVFPFTSESDIRNYAMQMLCVSQDTISRVVTLDSSGTTGKPKRVYFTGEDQELTVDFFANGMSTLTVPGDRVMIILPSERPGSVGDLLASAVERIGAIPVRHGIVQNIPGTLQMIYEADANVIVGIPVQILALAKFYELKKEHGISISIQRVLLSTDYVSKAVKSELERIFECEVFDHYGMTEMGLGGGIDCIDHGGYHLREADLYFEIVDPVYGKTVPEGEYGEVVFTTLTRDGMPMIRYRTGDISRFIKGDCPCGSALRRLDYIRCRKNSSIFLYGGNTLNLSDLDEKLLKIDGIVDYEVSYIKHNMVNRLVFKIITLNHIVNQSEVFNELSQIPYLTESIRNGILEIKIECTCYDADYIPKKGKRKIHAQNVE